MSELMYIIQNWDHHYEVAQTRKCTQMSWVALPNKHDGKSYRRLAAREDRVEIFAAWILIVQVASKCPRRGFLADEDGPIDADDLAFMTGFPREIFEKAFPALIDLSWVYQCSTSDLPAVYHPSTATNKTNKTNKYTSEFDAFWALYPRRISKGAACKAFQRALERVSLEEIMAGVQRYRAAMAKKEPQYVKHASTWLNQDCWTDEYESTQATDRKAHLYDINE